MAENPFANLRTFADYQRLEEEFQMKKQLANAQLQASQAALIKAGEIDVDKLGEQAFLKAGQGLPLTEQERAALKYVDAKSTGQFQDSVTGAIITKPPISERMFGGQGFPQAAQTQQSLQKPAPSQPVRAPEANVMPEQIGVPPTAESDDYLTQISAAQEAELAQAGGNRKLAQIVREKYATANTPQAKFEKENKLRDEFNALTKDFRVVQDAWSKIQTISDTPAGDLSLIYATAKLNDPGSVVREQDFVQQAKAGSFGDRVQNMVSQITTGNRLTPDQRTNLVNEAGLQYEAQKQGNDRILDNYKGIAQRTGADAANVITDYTALKSAPAQAIKNGTIADNPQTGEKLVYMDGQWKKF